LVKSAKSPENRSASDKAGYDGGCPQKPNRRADGRNLIVGERAMTASTAAKEFTARAYLGQRVEFRSSRSFDEVLATLRGLVGNATIKQVNERGSGSASREEFEERVRALEGESGFMLFFEIDHGQWIQAYGIRRK
jgi:hypothetical protein